MGFLNKQLTFAAALLLVCNTSVFGERWSRQLTPNAPSTANDWVPIRNGKMISFGEDLQQSAQTNYQFFAEPQNNRFNLQQQHPAHPSHPAASPSEINSFSVQNAPPPFQFFNQNSPRQRTVQNFGGSINKPAAEALVQNPPPFQFMQEIQRGPHVHHYQSQPIPKTLQNFPQSHPVPPFQQLSGQSRVPQFQSLQSPPPFQALPTPPQYQTIEQGEPQQPQSEEQVQLLYVPYDSLYQQNQQSQPQRDSTASRFNILNTPVSASLINDFYSQNEVQEQPQRPETTQRPFTTRRPTISPVTSTFLPTTPFESTLKPKPHQPPLSMFVAIDKFKGKATEADVLTSLKHSNKIDVMDSISKNSPNVFIGPSGMEAPKGYQKFDLPYLSSIEGTRFERKIEQLPFFVAPLSYKTPPGFSKIPLPAPHVGSIVVNQPPNTIDNNESTAFTQDDYFTKQPLTATVQSGQSHLEPGQKTQKIKLTSGFSYGPNGQVNLIKNEYTFPTLSPSTPNYDQSRSVYTTPRPTFAQTASPSTAETPLTRVAYKQIEEKRNYQSTYMPTTPRTTVTNSKLEHFPSSTRSTARATTTRPTSFTELEEHKTVNEEYFGFDKEKKPSFSFSFGSDVVKPSKNFNFKPIPDFDFGDSEFERETTKKPRTKATTKATTQYTFPSSTATPAYEFSPTAAAVGNQNNFGQVNGGSEGNFFQYHSSSRPTQDYTYNRFNFGNEQKTYTPDNAYTPQQYVNENVEQTSEEQFYTTDNPNYSLPSELPSISPQLPGWINSLMDDKWMQTPNVTEEDITTTTTEATTTTTRRTINRGSRRPVTSGSRSTATDSTVERRPVTRRGRPTTAYTSRNSVSSTESSFPSRSTESSYPSRSTVSRGNKVRYNGTSDERSRFRTRTRAPTTARKEEEIEYQRDVLNQNYPSSVRPFVAESSSTEKSSEELTNEHYQTQNFETNLNDYNTPVESVEVIPLGGNNENPSYPQNYFENTDETSTPTTTPTTTTTTTTTQEPEQEPLLPSNHKQNSFVGLQEQLQIPQHKKVIAHRIKGNFKNRNIDSFYSRETTQKPEFDEEILITVPTTQATTSTEIPTTEASTPRRTNFPRRRLIPTTTESSSTADGETTESYGGRTRSQGRKENVVVVKKVRGRVRQTTTTTEEPETTRRTVAIRTRTPYNRNTNRESTRDRVNESEEVVKEKPRFRIRENTPRFRLETQESQWSSRFNQNSFLPVDDEKSKTLREEVDDEQEIVTANPENEKDTFLFNVSASVLPTKAAEQAEHVDESINMISTTEKDVVIGKRVNNEEELGSSFDKFVKDVLEDIEEEDIKTESKNEKKAIGNEKKTANLRRGTWKRIKVRPADGFETAETQNIGKRLYNSVSNRDKKAGEKPKVVQPEARPTEVATTTEQLEHVFSETTTTAQPQEEEASPGMFDEARKALTELFSTEEDLDDAVNMEEADEKLEALNDSTTTAQIPTTEETTTVAPTLEVNTNSSVKSEESVVKTSSQQVQTSQSQKVTGEICYRGRCIKTEEQ